MGIGCLHSMALGGLEPSVEVRKKKNFAPFPGGSRDTSEAKAGICRREVNRNCNAMLPMRCLLCAAFLPTCPCQTPLHVRNAIEMLPMIFARVLFAFSDPVTSGAYHADSLSSRRVLGLSLGVYFQDQVRALFIWPLGGLCFSTGTTDVF